MINTSVDIYDKPSAFRYPRGNGVGLKLPSIDEKIDIGTVVKGKIVNVADYGAFLELTPGVEGLIHVSEMSWSQHLRNPSDFKNPGDEMDAVILSIDRNEKKMSLGVKQLTKDPWTDEKLLKKYVR